MSKLLVAHVLSNRNGSTWFDQPDGSTLVYSWRIDTKRGRAFAMWYRDRGDGKLDQLWAGMLKLDITVTD